MAAGSDYDEEYTIETGPDGVQYKVKTKIDHKPLIDLQGNPKPLRVPLIQLAISTTSCTTSGGSFLPGPVRVKYGTWVFPNYRCYTGVGTTQPHITGVDEIYGGYWYGTITSGLP
ncbi:hypothetical protein DI270_003595 [Microbispora triticiradicis]|uniref:Uncharacterized protein n=3 Tax=Microbispora TaxID=2005 RepID=A0ABY3LTV2_9ACTN|nr:MULTISPECIES: hypothetical protein [Microbispora]RGA06343.1 hypothetical protein DI270_003595 [Microbispora triticiradicis]TLP52143.1 hypothetical protein FED44_32720 [Microbispora fusca]TYB54418.1 hypothetical protein FXF59_22500 [Microbispora tritici]